MLELRHYATYVTCLRCFAAIGEGIGRHITRMMLRRHMLLLPLLMPPYIGASADVDSDMATMKVIHTIITCHTYAALLLGCYYDDTRRHYASITLLRCWFFLRP